MKLSSGTESKDKIIKIIKEFFDKNFIEATARSTKFVHRESKLQGVIFFSLCVYGQERGDDKFGGFMQRITKRRD